MLTTTTINYLQLVAIATGGPINSSKGTITLSWNNIERDENGYDITYLVGGAGNVNIERILSGTKSYTIADLPDSVMYQFRLTKYDIDNNPVTFDSNTVTTPDRTPPKDTPIFDNTMVQWLDQGANSGDTQVIKIIVPIPAVDAAYLQVIAVSGVGVKSSELMIATGEYFDKGLADNQIVFYKLRAIDSSSNYRDSATISVIIEDRSQPLQPTVENP
jgi:hypothetical protein